MLRAIRLLPLLMLLAAPAPAQAPAGDEPVSARADRLIHDDDNYDVGSTPRYRVKTDDPRCDVAAAAGLLESFRGFFDSVWSGRVELVAYDEPSRIYLFYSRFKYRQILPEGMREGDLPHFGIYQGLDELIALHTDTVGAEELADALVHEAAHQLIRRRLYGPDRDPSLWVAEGLASYFGNTLRDETGFQPGRIGGKSVELLAGAERRPRRMGWPQVKEYRRTLAGGRSRPLDEILRTAEPWSFYDEGAGERYVASWLLAHFLLHSDGGSRAGAFTTFLKADTSGPGSTELLYRSLGMSSDQLESAFREYVETLKAR